MPTPKRALGNSLERHIVAKTTAAGVKAQRQPRSGELVAFPADAVVANLLVEAKVRSARRDAKGRNIRSLNVGWRAQGEKRTPAEGKRGQHGEDGQTW